MDGYEFYTDIYITKGDRNNSAAVSYQGRNSKLDPRRSTKKVFLPQTGRNYGSEERRFEAIG